MKHQYVLVLCFAAPLEYWHHRERQIRGAYYDYCEKNGLKPPNDPKLLMEEMLEHYISSNHFDHSLDERSNYEVVEEYQISYETLRTILHDEVNRNGTAAARGWQLGVVMAHLETLATHFILTCKLDWAEALKARGFICCKSIKVINEDQQPRKSRPNHPLKHARHEKVRQNKTKGG